MKKHLLAVRALIEKGWTQGTWSRDIYGNPCWTTGQIPACWCITGAASEAIPNDEERQEFYMELAKYAPVVEGPQFRNSAQRLVAFNDHPTTTQADVLSMIDEAIAHASRTA